MWCYTPNSNLISHLPLPFYNKCIVTINPVVIFWRQHVFKFLLVAQPLPFESLSHDLPICMRGVMKDSPFFLYPCYSCFFLTWLGWLTTYWWTCSFTNHYSGVFLLFFDPHLGKVLLHLLDINGFPFLFVTIVSLFGSLLYPKKIDYIIHLINYVKFISYVVPWSWFSLLFHPPLTLWCIVSIIYTCKTNLFAIKRGWLVWSSAWSTNPFEL